MTMFFQNFLTVLQRNKVHVVLALLVCSHTLSAETQFQSSAQATSLIELYTSEGCYSCPPADRWLSNLEDSKGLFSEFVPLAFHVDYWNDLGWRDIYSRAEFSQRQRRYHQLGQVSGVYTPGMFLDGEEWRAWRSDNSNNINRARINKEKVGVLKVKYDKGKSTMTFNAVNDDIKPSRAYIALLGVGIQAPIQAGENKGKTLHHDFVVLDLQQAEILKSSGGSFVANLPKLQSELTAARYVLAAWVTDQDDRRPIQTTGIWIDSP